LLILLTHENIAELLSLLFARNPSSKLCVIAGVGHVKGRLGIPNRITKRTGTIPFVIVPEQVDWLPDTGLPDIIAPLSENECDWAWYKSLINQLLFYMNYLFLYF
jgi:hypothetical protein